METVDQRKYAIENRELVAQTHGLRVQVLTIGPRQRVPWHRHTRITDTFFCLEGPMVVETRRPNDVHELRTGDHLSVPPERAHTVYAQGGGRCKFVIVQGVGIYDYVPLKQWEGDGSLL